MSEAKSLILGIDPGLTGAVAVLEPATHHLVDVFDMPVIKIKNKKPKIDIHQLAHTLKVYAPKTYLAVIEEVGVMTGVEARSSMFNFGFGAGVLHGILVALDIPIIAVRPAVWKSLMGLSRDKKLSVDKAHSYFPNQKQMFTKVHNGKARDGRAEAALLAMIGTRFEKRLFA